jgi:hypothetical protein
MSSPSLTCACAALPADTNQQAHRHIHRYSPSSEAKQLDPTHLSFPSVCHVAVAGDVFRWVPAVWEY